MDSQTNALYDSQILTKHGLSEISFNSTNAQENSKSTKSGNEPSAISPNRKKNLVSNSNQKKVLEITSSPFLSPATSFVKSKQHHSMKSLKICRYLSSF